MDKTILTILTLTFSSGQQKLNNIYYKGRVRKKNKNFSHEMSRQTTSYIYGTLLLLTPLPSFFWKWIFVVWNGIYNWFHLETFFDLFIICSIRTADSQQIVILSHIHIHFNYLISCRIKMQREQLNSFFSFVPRTRRSHPVGWFQTLAASIGDLSQPFGEYFWLIQKMFNF